MNLLVGMITYSYIPAYIFRFLPSLLVVLIFLLVLVEVKGSVGVDLVVDES